MSDWSEEDLTPEQAEAQWEAQNAQAHAESGSALSNDGSES